MNNSTKLNTFFFKEKNNVIMVTKVLKCKKSIDILN